MLSNGEKFASRVVMYPDEPEFNARRREECRHWMGQEIFAYLCKFNVNDENRPLFTISIAERVIPGNPYATRLEDFPAFEIYVNLQRVLVHPLITNHN